MGGGPLTGKHLRGFMAPLGIKPEATRVALHRLKKDNWITSQKSGREVTYNLSPKGMAETTAVFGDVYDTAVKYPGGWQLVVLNDGAEPDGPVVMLGRTLAVVPQLAVPGPAVVMPVDISRRCHTHHQTQTHPTQ